MIGLAQYIYAWNLPTFEWMTDRPADRRRRYRYITYRVWWLCRCCSPEDLFDSWLVGWSVILYVDRIEIKSETLPSMIMLVVFVVVIVVCVDKQIERDEQNKRKRTGLGSFFFFVCFLCMSNSHQSGLVCINLKRFQWNDNQSECVLCFVWSMNVVRLPLLLRLKQVNFLLSISHSFSFWTRFFFFLFCLFVSLFCRFCCPKTIERKRDFFLFFVVSFHSCWSFKVIECMDKWMDNCWEK